jgi:undecaprenyl-diphosphatase
MEVFTFLGSHKFLIPAFLLLFAYYFFIRKDKWYAIRIAVLSVANLLLLFGFKFIFDRSRPLNPLFGEVPGLSFPSGHALMGVIFFGLIINIVCRQMSNAWIKWISIMMLVMVILLIGLSRIYLRLHYTSDVIAGYFIGLLSFLMLWWMLNKVEMTNARKECT